MYFAFTLLLLLCFTKSAFLCHSILILNNIQLKKDMFDKENHQNTAVSLDTTTNAFFPNKAGAVVSNTTATLICEKFQGAVWVGFGCVALHCTTTREFNLVNPSSSSVDITVDKCPAKKGFTITFGENGASSVSVGPAQTVSGHVHWRPPDSASVREVVTLLMDKKHRLQLTLHGIAGMGTVSPHC